MGWFGLLWYGIGVNYGELVLMSICLRGIVLVIFCNLVVDLKVIMFDKDM